MPHGARLNGKYAVTCVDKLAALAGIRRPNSRRDPVHFKLLPERPETISYAQSPAVTGRRKFLIRVQRPKGATTSVPRAPWLRAVTSFTVPCRI